MDEDLDVRQCWDVKICIMLDGRGDLNLHGVTDSEYESVKKLRTGQYALVSNEELTQLKHDAELGKA